MHPCLQLHSPLETKPQQTGDEQVQVCLTLPFLKTEFQEFANAYDPSVLRQAWGWEVSNLQGNLQCPFDQKYGQQKDKQQQTGLKSAVVTNHHRSLCAEDQGSSASWHPFKDPTELRILHFVYV